MKTCFDFIIEIIMSAGRRLPETPSEKNAIYTFKIELIHTLIFSGTTSASGRYVCNRSATSFILDSLPS